MVLLKRKEKMKKEKIIFWAVDCQKDFMNKDGALYVEGAEEIKPNLKILTEFAKKHDIMVVNTRDAHVAIDEELSDNPDFINTFPEHCIIGTTGMDFIDETTPENSSLLFYGDSANNYIKLNCRNIIINKNKFDVFEGNPHTEKLLDLINPDLIIVYGVAGDYCVHYAIEGLVKRKYKVIVIRDSIKSIKEDPINKWRKLGVNVSFTVDIIEFVTEI